MTPLWHDGPLATLAPGDDPVVWSVPLSFDPGVGANADDLADAARVADGAARLARRLLLRALVARRADFPANAVSIGRDPFGAPRVFAPEGWHVSSSGRDGRALIGVARSPIGVDREALETADILWDTLGPRETEALRALPLADRPRAWLTRWTMKEAHAKLVGEPRRIAPERIETAIGNDGVGVATFEGRSDVFLRIAHGGIETVAMWTSPS